MKIEVVSAGEWENRKFDGIMVDDVYFAPGEARYNEDSAVRAAYCLARRAWREKESALFDAPLKEYWEDGKTIWHHDLREQLNECRY